MTASLRTLASYFRLTCGSAKERRRRTGLSGARRSAVETLEFRALLTNPLTAIPLLNSLPGAPVNIYLDFDGHTETQDWPGARTDGATGAVVTPVFDVDGDGTTFSDEELRMIEEVWYRVSEDFKPFRVNVTTVDPLIYNDFETVFVSIGGNGSWIGSPGGIAWLNSFSNGQVNTVYAFTDNTGFGGVDHMKGTAMTVSHEVGHALGLNHHSVWDAAGNKTAEYNAGAPDLGPIMGAPYTSFRETWNDGPGNAAANSFQDDLAVMTRAGNLTFQYRTDDTGNTIAAASPILVSGPNISRTGIIERTGDVDMYRVESNTGNISFSVDGLDLRTVYSNTALNPGTNLDLVLRLYDANGTLIAEDDSTTSLSAQLSASVSSGVYYVGVTTTGEYGALGEYTLTGTVIPLPSTPTMISPTGVLANPIPVFEWTAGANAASYELQVDNLTTGRDGFYVRSVSGTQHTADLQFVQGEFRARVRSVALDGSFSAWSEYITFTIDVPAPVQPILTRPSGPIATSFPIFLWQGSAQAATYNLEVINVATNARVIYRTNFQSTSYQHFEPLRDGNYRAVVQAFNSVGEASPLSDPVEFQIDAPAPTAPTITGPATTTTDINPVITWEYQNEAWKYDLWIDYRNTNTSQFVRNQNIVGTTSYQLTNLPQGTYNVWVRAINGNNEVGVWSSVYTFTVDVLPPARPTMTGPVVPAGTNVTTLTPTFTWTAAERAEKYDLWVNNETTGQVQIIRKVDLTSTSYTPLTGLPEGRYQAWVRGINSAGEVGQWSSALSFRIDQPTPSTPVFTGPSFNAAGSVESSTPTFTWTSDPNAVSYEFWMDDITSGVSKKIYIPRLTTNSYTVPDSMRLNEFTYRAWVRAFNAAGDPSFWSKEFRFRVDVPNPTTPQIVGPSSTLKTRTPKFEWIHSPGSVKYEILVRDLDRQEQIVLNVTTFTVSPDGSTASYTLPSNMALQNGTYRFWIRAFNTQGTASAWSASRTFAISVTQNSSEPAGEQELMAAVSDPIVTMLKQSALRQSSDVQPAEAAEVEVQAAVTAAGFSTEIAGQPTSQRDSLGADMPAEELALSEVMALFADPTAHFPQHAILALDTLLPGNESHRII